MRALVNTIKKVTTWPFVLPALMDKFHRIIIFRFRVNFKYILKTHRNKGGGGSFTNFVTLKFVPTKTKLTT